VHRAWRDQPEPEGRGAQAGVVAQAVRSEPAFDTDDVGMFLDLVQRLRTTEASRYTIRDTPSFTCLAMSLPRALNALDGEPVALESALPAL
jgi:hypothetical protein